MIPSSEATAHSFPSGLNDTPLTVWPRFKRCPRGSPVAVSHNWAYQRDPVASSLPSGLNARVLSTLSSSGFPTGLPWGSPSAGLQSWRSPLRNPVASSGAVGSRLG